MLSKNYSIIILKVHIHISSRQNLLLTLQRLSLRMTTNWWVHFSKKFHAFSTTSPTVIINVIINIFFSSRISYFEAMILIRISIAPFSIFCFSVIATTIVPLHSGPCEIWWNRSEIHQWIFCLLFNWQLSRVVYQLGWLGYN